VIHSFQFIPQLYCNTTLSLLFVSNNQPKNEYVYINNSNNNNNTKTTTTTTNKNLFEKEQAEAINLTKNNNITKQINDLTLMMTYPNSMLYLTMW